MKLRRVFHDGLIYTLAHIMTKGIGFLMIPFYTMHLSTTEYGLFDSIVIFGQFLMLIGGLEIHQSMARFLPEATNDEEKSEVVSTGFIALLFLSSFLVLNLLIFGPYLVSYLGVDQSYLFKFQIASVSFGFSLIYNFMQSQLIYHLKVHANIITSFFYACTVASVAYYLIGTLEMSIEAIFIAQIVGSIVGMIIAYINSSDYYRVSFSRSMLKMLLEFSTPLILSNLTLTLMVNIDRIVITDILTISDLGLYGVAYRFAAVVSFGITGFQTALTPLIYMHYKDKSTPFSIAKLTHYFLLVSVVIVVVMYFSSSFIVQSFTGQEYWNSHSLIPWIAASLLFGGAINFAPGIFIAKQTKWALYINIFCLFSNTTLNYLLINGFGLIGAAYATAISSFLYLFLYYWVGQRYYFIPYFWSSNSHLPGVTKFQD